MRAKVAKKIRKKAYKFVEFFKERGLDVRRVYRRMKKLYNDGLVMGGD